MAFLFYQVTSYSKPTKTKYREAGNKTIFYGTCPLSSGKGVVHFFPRYGPCPFIFKSILLPPFRFRCRCIQDLKWLVTRKLHFFVGFPPSAQDFFWVYNMYLKRPSLRLFRIKIDQFVSFGRFEGVFKQKGTYW